MTETNQPHDAGVDALRPRGVSIDEAARLIGVSRRTVYELVARGRLRTCKLGRRRIVPVAAIDELLEGRGR